MQRFFQLFCSLAIVFCLVLAGTPEASAKKSSSSKNSKSKNQARGSSKKSSKNSSRKSAHSKNRRSHRQSPTVARGREKTDSQSERETERPRSSAYQTEQSLTPNQTRNRDANSSTDQNSQDENQQLAPPAPRPVISSIPTERVAEIQYALIKQGYLTGEASGIYDDSTKAAMKKFQVANNLQASGLPSAHALKRLGVSKRGNSLSQVPVKTKSDTEKEP